MSAPNANALVHALYGKVVTDVVAKSREDFLGEGLDASVLEELQTRWERKLAATGAAPAPAAGAVAAAAPPPPRPQAKGRAAAASKAAAAPAATAAAGTGPSAAEDEPLALLGRPLAFLPAGGAWVTDTPSVAAPAPLQDAPAPQDASRKRKEPESALEPAPRAAQPPPAPAVVAPLTHAGAGDGEDSDDEERDPETKNLVLSQFDKVTHAKNKWKAVLRSGIVTLAGKDCVFNTATGDFSW